MNRSIPNHTVNSETGYIENLAYADAFDSDKKIAFLRLYKDNGLRLRRACDSLGMSMSTIHSHYRTDKLFRENFDAIEKQYIEDLEAISRQNALNPRSVIERIFQLKCLLPAKYGQENKPITQNITITLDGNFLESMKKREKIIDLEANVSTLEKAQLEQNNGVIV